MTLRYISMFSGIESASVAWHPLGWTPVCFAEPAKAPARILAHRWPDVPNVGDMTCHDWSQYRGTVDVVVGGPPCQAFSIAGLRRGLDDERGNLSLAFAKAIHAIGPNWAVIENVPGWLSMPDNAFGCMLAALVGGNDPVCSPLERGRWPDAGMVAGPRARVAWRVLDAQYFGLAQRRARVFVVAGFRTWTDPAAVLFEPKGVSGDHASRREAGARVAALTANGVGASGADDNQAQAGHLIAFGGNNQSGPIDVATAVRAKGGTGHGDFESETFVAHALRGEGFDASEDGTGRSTPLVPVPFDTTQVTSPTNRSAPRAGDPCHPLAAQGHAPAIAFSAKDYGNDAAAELAPTLRAMGHAGSHANGGGQVAIAIPITADALRGTGSAKTPSADATGRVRLRDPGLGVGRDGDPASTIQAQRPGAVATASQVRRLTPRECERLQVFPDDYTRVPVRTYKTKPRSKHAQKYADLYDRKPDGTWVRFLDDGPRYKCLGNSKAVPCVRWIGARIDAVTRRSKAGAS